MNLLFFISFIIFPGVSEAYTLSAIEDQITSLPNAIPLNFTSFSGYLPIPTNSNDGTGDGQQEHRKMMHYIYTESQNDPVNDPIIFWTNGGPGCSGLVGFFTEMGPWRPIYDQSTGDIILIKNQFAWNTRANIVYLEQPVGVGFSYEEKNDNSEVIGDQSSIRDLLNAIVQFFIRFPERKVNKLYFASESYGGHYIPELTQHLLESEHQDIKNQLHGLLIGNPFVSFGTGLLSRGLAFWNFQLIPRSLWLRYQANSCDDMNLTIQQFSNTCWDILNKMFEKATPHLDYYGANFPVCNSSSSSSSTTMETTMTDSWMTPLSAMKPTKSQAATAATFSSELASAPLATKLQHFKTLLQLHRRHQQSSRNLVSTSSIHRRVEDSREWFDDDNEDSIGYVECSSEYMREYLNLEEVKIALHVNPSIHWLECNDDIFNDWPYEDFFANKIPLYQQILNENTQLDILVFSGDTDIICPTIGTQHWIFSLDLEIKSLWRPWTHHNQTAGYLTQFSNKFSFVTIHSAGHMVPRYQPGRGYEVLSRYLHGDWFKITPEGLILTCGYFLEIEQRIVDNSSHEQQNLNPYLYLKWAIRYLFEFYSKKYHHTPIDFWAIEVYDLAEKNNLFDDDEDDDAAPFTSASTSATSTTTMTSNTHHQKFISNLNKSKRQLKKHEESTTKTHSLLILLEILVPNYETGLLLKSSLDVFYKLAFLNHFQIFSTIIHFTYLEQFKYSNLNSFLYEFSQNEIKILSYNLFSGYSLDLIPLTVTSSASAPYSAPAPTPSASLVSSSPHEWNYFLHNITWKDLDLLIYSSQVNDPNQDQDQEEGKGNEDLSDYWYEHLLILSSQVDVGDILILLFLPIGILFGVIFLFQSYQHIHDRILSEMGYEIQYDYSQGGGGDSESGYGQNTTPQPSTTPTPTQRSTPTHHQEKRTSQIELGSY